MQLKSYKVYDVDKNINRLVYVPVAFFVGGIALFILFYYFYIREMTQKEFYQTVLSTKDEYKNYLKINVDSIVKGVNEIRTVSYNSTEQILSNILNTVYVNFKDSKNKKKFLQKYFSKKLFFYVISKNYIYPSFYQTYIKIRKKHLITVYKGRRYLSVEKKYKNFTLGVAFDLDILNNIIKKEIIDYISSLNHGKNYIAVSHITDWNAKKGYFGTMIYHPLKNFIGYRLSVNIPDIKGDYFRKKYFDCLKNKNGCFEEYYFKNPATGKIEKKLSYFRIYRPYDYIFVKGVYYSDISRHIKILKYKVFEKFQRLFLNTLFFLVFFIILSLMFAQYILDKIKSIVISECNSLKQKYEKSKNELTDRIYYDKLTSLPTRVKLEEDIERFHSLVLLDIVEFSNINNLYGYDFGNDILKCVSEYLKKNYQNVYRVDSDEFALMFENKINDDLLRDISSKIINCYGVEISFVIGASNIKNLFITAESALKNALRSNSKYYIYKIDIKEKQKKKIELLKKLRRALKENKVIPYFQPIVDKNRNVVKYEALIRVKTDEGIIAPFKFMELIKEAKLYDEFSSNIIKKIFKYVQKQNTYVSINLSFIDIANNETRRMILESIKNYGIAKKITFEILESESIKNINLVKDFVKMIKNYGAKIAIDDFGSGYSNLVNILSLAPDYIKIDGSLVRNIKNEKYFEIIKLISAFAKKFNITVVAEYVENEDVFESLKNINIECFQGYYFGKPVPFDKIS